VASYEVDDDDGPVEEGELQGKPKA